MMDTFVKCTFVAFMALFSISDGYGQCNFTATKNTDFSFSGTGCSTTPSGINFDLNNSNNPVTVTFDQLVTSSGGATITSCSDVDILFTANTTISGNFLPGCNGTITFIVASGTTLTVTGNIGDGSKNMNLQVAGTLSVSGNLNLRQGSLTVEDGGSVTVGGTTNSDNGASITLNGSSSFETANYYGQNGATITVGSNADFSVPGTMEFNNNASVEINGTLTVTNLKTQNTFTATGNGLLEVTNSVEVGNNSICGSGSADVNAEDCNLSFSGNGFNNCVSPTSDFCIDAGIVIALPVVLVSFNVIKRGREYIASWSTASELNNDFFTLEESADGYGFEEVAKIKGSGNSLSTINYHHSFSPLHSSKVLYYRLKQTDYDGSYYYSPVVSLEGEEGQLKVNYQNPFSGEELTVTNLPSGTTDISIVDFAGRTISSVSIPEALPSGVEISIKKIQKSGIYLLRIQTLTGFINKKLYINR